MKNLITKKIITVFAVTFAVLAMSVPAFAQWDVTSGGNYTGGWDETSGSNSSNMSSGAWDVTSGGNYTGGWDVTSGGNYTGGWDVTSGGNYTGGWDVTSGGNYTGGWDTTSGGNSPSAYTGGWETVQYTAVPYNAVPYSSAPIYTSGGSFGTVVPTTGSFGTFVPTLGSTANFGTVTFTNSNTNIICSDGLAPVNGSCTRTTTLPTSNTVICSDGTTPINGSCVRTTTLPVTNNTVCSDGTLPVNGSCTRTTTLPTSNTVICSDGRTPINGSCSTTTVIPTVTYQTCWDGSVIPTTSVCPQQYKTCPNGTSVPVSQVCYMTTPVYVPPQVVKFNNVVTSIATEITKTSGRCNGIGLIANNAPSTGWFEYGETSALGRTTATANIGQANTAPFSNVLTNLKPSTRYYCRAVMQNQYGLVKGEVVSFVTKSTATTYVKPVVTKTPVTTTKKPVTQNVITCSDGTTVNTKSTTSAKIINQGEKLVMVQVEKAEGNLTPGESVRYKVIYKNTADTRVTGVVVKVVLPQEVAFAGATAGTYDPQTRTLTLAQDMIDPYSEGIIMITGTVAKDAPVGKTIVTNVYALYTVPGTYAQDEVTAYVVGSIMPATAISNVDTGAKKVIGQGGERGFMPSTLIEWLALLAILFILFILGRSVYASYKDEGSHKH